MKREKQDKVLFDCYRELFANSDPKGDFYELVANAKVNDSGQKEIPFNDYEISRELFESILDKHASKIYPKWSRTAFKNAIYLGCSPKWK